MAEGDAEAGEQVQLARRFVSRELTTADFIEGFLEARHRWVAAIWNVGSDFEGLLNDVNFDVDRHNAYDDLRQPDEFDDEQLRVSIARRIRDWDAGTYVTQYE
jgi:hypothetical protein